MKTTSKGGSNCFSLQKDMFLAFILKFKFLKWPSLYGKIIRPPWNQRKNRQNSSTHTLAGRTTLPIIGSFTGNADFFGKRRGTAAWRGLWKSICEHVDWRILYLELLKLKPNTKLQSMSLYIYIYHDHIRNFSQNKELTCDVFLISCDVAWHATSL